MSGESIFGWIKAILLLVVIAAIAIIVWKGWSAFMDALDKLKKFGSDAGDKIASAAKTVAKAPSAIADAGASTATGREESFGGLLAEWLDPNTRKVADLYGARKVKPISPNPGGATGEW
jgi:hypothetical protein